MLDIIILALVVLVTSFISDQTIDASTFENAKSVCATHEGLKSLNSIQVFGNSESSALCNSGIQVKLIKANKND